MRVIILTLVLAAAFAQSSPPTMSKQQKTANEKQKVSMAPETPAEVINNQKSPSEEGHRAVTEQPRTSEKSIWGDVPTWLLVIVGAIAAWIAVRTLEDIKIQTQNAGIAARAAETSANAIIRSERPWLLISAVRFESVVWETGRVQGAYFIVQNYGKSPAWVVNMGGTFETLNNLGELPSEPVYEHSANEEKRGIVIVPVRGSEDRTENHVFKFPHHSLTEHGDFQKVVNEKKATWCIYGFVSYRDVFDMENIHETRFCYRLDNYPNFRAVDAGPNYNRHT
jgi:hypothetical protein